MIHKLFTLPIKSLINLAEKIEEEVTKEMYDLNNIKNELLQLHLSYESNQLEEEQYIQKEQELLERYRIAKQRESR